MLPACSTSASLFAPSCGSRLYCASRTAAWLGNFPPLISFAPLDPCPALVNFLKRLLVIFVGRNTVPAVLRTRSFLFGLLALRLAPCLHHVCFLPSFKLICGPRLYCASRTTCLLCFLVVSLCHTEPECTRNNTHISPQPSTVMLRQPVLGSFQPVTPALVTTSTPILHLSQCSPRSTSSASHHPALQKFAHADTTTRFLLQRNTFIHVFSVAQHMYVQSVAQHFYNSESHMNAACCIESSHL